MSTNTPNYNLEKPNEEEFYDVNVQNGNMDKIDSALKTLAVEVESGVSQEDLTAIDTKLDDINQGVDEINGKSDQIKQGVDNLNTKQDSLLFKIQNGALKQNVAVFDKPGTYTWKCPDGVTVVVLTMFGGGGSGAIRTITEYQIVSGDGGGGAYVDQKLIKVIPGTTYSLVVGAGGAGVSAADAINNYANGKAGGVTSAFGIICNGGAGGSGLGNVAPRATGNSPLCNKGTSSPRAFSQNVGADNVVEYIFAGNRFGLPGEHGGGAGFGDGGDANGSAPVANGAGSGGADAVPSVNRTSLKGGDGIIIIEY